MNKILARAKKSEKIEYLFLLIILLSTFAVRLYKINNPIGDWHAWRQVDTASVTRIYLDEGINLLYPKYYDISPIQTGTFNPEGLRFVEFPVFNLLHYGLVRLVPQISFPAAGRLISIFSAVATSLGLYILGKRYLGKWGGLLAALFYGIMPFNIYFTRVILPEPLAVALSVWGLLTFVEYIYRDKWYLVILSGIFFSLAMLVKPFAFFYGFPVLYIALREFKFKRIFRNYPLLIALDLVLIPFLIWRWWLDKYPVGVPHLAWAFNGDDIRFRPAFWRWIFGERIGRLILGMWAIIPFSYGLISRTKDWFTHFFFAGMIMYVTLIATANVRHDYYQTFIIPAIALLLAAGSQAMWNKKGDKIEKFLTRSLMIFSLGLGMGISLYEIRGNYNINHYEIIVAGEAIDRIAEKDAWVIAPYNGDTTFLYNTKRRGWPVVNDSIDNLIKLGADYYVSVNNDTDTNNFAKRYKTLEKTNDYTILDLHQEL